MADYFYLSTYIFPNVLDFPTLTKIKNSYFIFKSDLVASVIYKSLYKNIYYLYPIPLKIPCLQTKHLSSFYILHIVLKLLRFGIVYTIIYISYLNFSSSCLVSASQRTFFLLCFLTNHCQFFYYDLLDNPYFILCWLLQLVEY